jgi:hypothetical protein
MHYLDHYYLTTSVSPTTTVSVSPIITVSVSPPTPSDQVCSIDPTIIHNDIVKGYVNKTPAAYYKQDQSSYCIFILR